MWSARMEMETIFYSFPVKYNESNGSVWKTSDSVLQVYANVSSVKIFIGLPSIIYKPQERNTRFSNVYPNSQI